ncbi:MAG: cation:proton antiporter, partial [Alloprevotella sp.]|nr:cation:proton antiporter [Alloprevotella sp.]
MSMPITDPTWIFLVILAIILVAPMILERLKVPSIVGLIFAGVLVGPFGFHVLDKDASFELFGKVGIYYIMFLASLEMNMQDIRKTRALAIGFGLLSFAIPFATGLFANWGILRYGLTASLLMASMYASHTLISYPIVLRYGLARRNS